MRPIWKYYRDDLAYMLDSRPRVPAWEDSPDDPRLINPLPRFSQIFPPIFAGNLDGRDRRELENVFLHFLALLDFSCGQDRRQIWLRILRAELETALWGENAASCFNSLDEAEKNDIANFLYEMEFRGAQCLDRALREWFPGILPYCVVESGEIILCMPQNGDKANCARLNLLLELFAPMRQVFHIYWQKAPCLMDEPEARLDSCLVC